LIPAELFYHALLLRLEDSSHTLEINSLHEKKTIGFIHLSVVLSFTSF
jgi:hypothetical protein